MKPSNHRLHWKTMPTLSAEKLRAGVLRSWPVAYVCVKGEMKPFALLSCLGIPYKSSLATSGNHPPLAVYIRRMDTGELIMMNKKFCDVRSAKIGVGKFVNKYPEMLK